MAATAAISAPERQGQILEAIPVAASVNIYVGTIVALDSSGNANPAADSAGLHVIGRCEGISDTDPTSDTIKGSDALNGSGLAGAMTINVKRGVFRWANYGSDLIAKANIGQPAYVYDNQTVRLTKGTNGIVAGVIVDVDSDGVWVDTTRRAPVIGLETQTEDTITDSTGGTAATASGGAITIAAVPTFTPSVAWNGSSVYPSAADATAIEASIAALRNAISTLAAEAVKNRADILTLIGRLG